MTTMREIGVDLTYDPAKETRVDRLRYSVTLIIGLFQRLQRDNLFPYDTQSKQCMTQIAQYDNDVMECCK